MNRKFVYIILLSCLSMMQHLHAQETFTEDSLYMVYQGSRDNEVKVNALIDLSLQVRLHDVRKSLGYAHMALETAKQSDSSLLMAKAYNNLATAFIQGGDFRHATEMLLESKKILEDLDNKRQLVGITSNLGALRYQLEDLDGALAYFQEALEMNAGLLEEGDSTYMDRMHIFYINMGSIYSQKGDQESAVEYMSRALKSARRDNDLVNQGKAANNLGEIYLKMDDRSRARKYLLMGLKIRENNHDLKGMAMSYLYLAQYYLVQMQTDSAKQLNLKALDIGEALGLPDILKDVYEQQAAIFEREGQFRNAGIALRQYYSLRDSIQNENIQNMAVRLEMNYELEKLESMREDEKYRSLIRTLAITGVLFFLLIIFILLLINYRNRNKRIRAEKEVLEKNLEVKNKELATNVMFMVRKNESMLEISNRLKELMAMLREENKPALRQAIRDLQTASDQDSWKEFEVRFQQVHTSFFSDLQKDFPDLTPGELKICAFLRLNMSSKEISSITKQAVKSIEVTRSRIRKKLHLTGSEENLVSFLTRF